jgi:hypothetical protein
MQEKLNDLVYIQYNRKLELRYKETLLNINDPSYDPIVLREVDENDDWVIPSEEELEEFVRVGDDLLWRQVREAQGVVDVGPSTRSRSRTQLNDIHPSIDLDLELDDEEEFRAPVVEEANDDDFDIDIEVGED